MLEVEHIDVGYGDVQVIRDLSFAVNRGEVVALVGANGAGKSTVLKAISGLLKPARGSIRFEGRPIHDSEPFHRPEQGIAHVPEGRRLFPEMTVDENLDLGALRGEARGLREQTKAAVYDLFPRLRERRRQRGGTLSGGEQQMAAVGRGLMARPRLIMFDEPSLGLAPIVVREIFSVISRIRSEGTTVLLVEQNVKQTLQIADRAYVIETGRIVLEGRGAELLDHDHVRTAYLGI